MPSPTPTRASSAPSSSSGANPVAPPVAWTRYLIYFGLLAGVLALDLATKHWAFDRLGFPGVRHDRIALVGDYLGLETNLNEGALFGMAQGKRLVFIPLAGVAILGIMGWLFIGRGANDLLLTIALGSVTGGILGNLWDRLGLHGMVWPGGERFGQPVYAVRDWVHFEIPGVFDWPVFNIADSALVIGVTLLMWQTFRTSTPATLQPTDSAAASAKT